MTVQYNSIQLRVFGGSASLNATRKHFTRSTLVAPYMSVENSPKMFTHTSHWMAETDSIGLGVVDHDFWFVNHNFTYDCQCKPNTDLSNLEKSRIHASISTNDDIKKYRCAPWPDGFSQAVFKSSAIFIYKLKSRTTYASGGGNGRRRTTSNKIP